MKRNYIVKHQSYCLSALFILAMISTLVTGCSQHKTDHLLKPSNEQIVSKLPVIKAEYGTKILTEEVQGIINYDTRNQSSISSRVNGRITHLWLKYNYQPVRKGQLIMEIYSPELAAAQQELLFFKRNKDDPTMLESARQRLMLLGMTVSDINQVLEIGKVNYRVPVYSNVSGYILERSAPVSNTGDAPVMLREGQYVNAGQSLFIIYNADRLVAEFSLKPMLAASLKKGDKLIYQTSDKSSEQTAHIGMILPVFKNGENFTLARVYLNNSNFRVGELLTAKLSVSLPKSWWLPQSAVISLGNKTVLFKKEANVFIPKVVRTGITVAGMVQVKEDIGNWELSKNAAYLVDSESFIKN